MAGLRKQIEMLKQVNDGLREESERQVEFELDNLIMMLINTNRMVKELSMPTL